MKTLCVAKVESYCPTTCPVNTELTAKIIYTENEWIYDTVGQI